MARVLVCDDDKLFGALMRRALEQHGHAPTVVEDAKSARSALSSERYDAFVCDIVLPDENGLHLLRGVRIADPNLTLIAVSGGKSAGRSVHVDVLSLAETVGADAVVKKPFELTNFVATIETALARKKHDRASVA